jgi:FkbM family methyltransferase
MELKYVIKRIIQENEFLRILLKPIIRSNSIIKNKKANKNAKQFNSAFERIFSRLLPTPVLIDLFEFCGIFEIDIRSDLFRTIAFQGCYENDLLKIVSQFLDTKRDAVDIGANVGFYSVYFAKNVSKSCKVLSVEPIPKTFEFLKKNIERNNCVQEIILYNGALTDQVNGNVTLNTMDGREEYSSLGEIDKKYVKNSKVNQLKVQSTTLDDLVFQNNIKPGFIKIDTEGAEFLVLKGSLKTIQAYKPIIISELVDDFLKKMDHSAKDVIDLLKSYNYRIIDANTLTEKISYPFIGEIIAIPR